MAQWAKHLLRKSDNLSSIPRTYVKAEGENQFSDSHITHCDARTHTSNTEGERAMSRMTTQIITVLSQA